MNVPWGEHEIDFIQLTVINESISTIVVSTYECQTSRAFFFFLIKCNVAMPFWKAFWEFIIKLRVVLLSDPAIRFLGIYLADL